MALLVDIERTVGSFHLQVQFSAQQEMTALLGPSGCGKSMTLQCIAGILTPDQGHIELDGTVLFDSAAGINLPPQQRQVGYLFQSYALFPHMRVLENVAVGIRGSRKHRLTAARALLRRFRLEGLEQLRPAQLSGGQQQRVALARILAAQPKAILLDEPLSALDSHLKWELEVELENLLDGFDGPVLWVSHDREEVCRHCKNVCVLDQGRSRGVQTMEQLLHAPNSVCAARLAGYRNFVPCRADEIPLWNWRLPRAGNGSILCLPPRAFSPASDNAPDALSVRILRVLQDPDRIHALVLPEQAAPDAPPLWLELPPEAPPQTGQRLWIRLDPDQLLFFRD